MQRVEGSGCPCDFNVSYVSSFVIKNPDTETTIIYNTSAMFEFRHLYCAHAKSHAPSPA